MSFTSCWFRPSLDAFGAWAPDGDAPDRLTNALHDAGQAAEARLKEYYWAFARSYGADAFARALGAAEPDHGAGVLPVRAIAALDYFSARARVPAPWPGGPANPRNRALRRQLEPYLADRLVDRVSANAAESIVWRAIIARLPTTGVMLDALERAFERRLRDQNDSPSGAYRSVKVALDLKLSTPGADGWIAERLPRELEAMRARLKAGTPALVELIRDPSASPMAELVVVYHAEQRTDGAWRIVYHDPALSQRASVLTIRLEDDCARFSTEGEFHDRPVPRALRCWDYAPAVPPLFGLRRLLRHVLPWRWLWYVSRAVRLLFMRRP